MLTSAAFRVSLALLALAFGVFVCGCPLTDDRRPSDAAADARDGGSDR